LKEHVFGQPTFEDDEVKNILKMPANEDPLYILPWTTYKLPANRCLQIDTCK